MSAITTAELELEHPQATLACKTKPADNTALEEGMMEDIHMLKEILKGHLVEEAELVSGWAEIKEAMWARNWAVWSRSQGCSSECRRCTTRLRSDSASSSSPCLSLGPKVIRYSTLLHLLYEGRH